MCGIATIVCSGHGLPLLPTLAVMHREQASRGPDGEGCLTVDASLRPTRLVRLGDAPPDQPLRVAAAIHRLAILDARPLADQPLARRDGQLWILHNGEIFNHSELRRALSADGYTFDTNNDAETMLAAYEAWGPGCFARLRGMWATIIVDLVAGRVLLSRDRLGIKPLFYARVGNQTVAASHPTAVACALPGGVRINVSRWNRFLQGFPPQTADDGFFEGVHAVPAGSYLSIDLGHSIEHVTNHRFWDLDAVAASRTSPYAGDQTRDELLALLESSVAEQVVADRTVGCLLSGGLDSSLVSTLAARFASNSGVAPPSCFSIVFDDRRMSEWPYMQMVAAHAGVPLVTHCLSRDEAWSLVDPVVMAQGEPLLGQDILAQYRAFRLAREHGSVVVLEGQGADELFAGMPLYESVMFEEWLYSGQWGTLWNEARRRSAAEGKAALTLVLGLALSPAVRRLSRGQRFDWLVDVPAPVRSASWENGDGERSRDPSRLNRYLFNLIRRTNLPFVLLAQDRMAMAHGVENRPPFLDHRLVEWAFRLSPQNKVSGGKKKRVVWEAAHHVLPSIVTARVDKKTIVSRNDWMNLRTHFLEPLSDMARSAALRSAPGIDGVRMTRFVDDYFQGRHDDHNAVWRLYTGSRWLELFQPGA